MRSINISNDKKRDAAVCLESIGKKKTVRFILSDGRERENVKILKSTLELSEEILSQNYEDLRALGEAIIAADPEVNMELTGKRLEKTHKLYLNKDNKIAYRVTQVKVIHKPDGTEVERKNAEQEPANVNVEIPIQWSGKKFPKSEAIKKFVFTRKYQIKHVSGLTFDFLYDMAKDLHESKSLMRMGAGKKGNERIRVVKGGEEYFGFLEGRVDGEKYCLILHLTSMEMKGI